ncbi:unnamed protein product [Rotaria sp. Silwood1]|nr:unnamed protein product [Rotaria sp. Silwood1]CAF1002956.1 unnamed protein product [Rotaria sp. Silwood1]CAF3411781.1 unnamed protein product [Rotaria sp. Silwood1]CAF4708023.1 unnamed protein product [Rotaria sp. Silwood1]
MCTHSVSGSSLLSGYDEDDVHETSGRSRREFEQIDAVLYNEEVPKRLSIKKICDEWSSKPHFRVRGRLYSSDLQQDINQIETRSSILSSNDHLSNHFQISSLDTSKLNVRLDETASGHSSIDTIDGSELSDDSDLDNHNEFDDAYTTSTILGDHFSTSGADSFDTDDIDDENGNYSLAISKRNRTKYTPSSIKCVKDSIINSLALSILQRFLTDEQPLLQCYIKNVVANNSIRIRTEPRPSSLPSRSSSLNRLSQPIIPTNFSLQQNPTMTTSSPSRSTPEANIELACFLHIKGLHGTNSNTNHILTTSSSSPRKPQTVASNSSTRIERTLTNLSIEKRNQQQQQQQISLIGTAIANFPLQLISSTQKSSQSQTRQTSSTRRHYSATINNSNTQNLESITRLPPIPNEHIITNDPLMINRSNTITTAIMESIPPVTRVVSGKSTTSTFSSTTKLRTHANVGKLHRPSRSIIITSNKDINYSPSISPTRSIATTTIPTATLKTTALMRTHQQQSQKKSLITTKSTQPSSSSTAIKMSATHIC